MKFTVSQSALQTALDIVSKGIGSNTTLPILSGIYLKAFNGMLELQSSDLTISIKHQIAANVEEEGETVVSGKVIQNIVKNLPQKLLDTPYRPQLIEAGLGAHRFSQDQTLGIEPSREQKEY